MSKQSYPTPPTLTAARPQRAAYPRINTALLHSMLGCAHRRVN